MLQATGTTSLAFRNPFSCRLATWSVWPLFVAVEGLRRLLVHGVASHTDRERASRSVLAEAHEQACIAISYAFMARSMLQQFGRDNRPERRS